jgi:bla regulator protein BlaR1
MIGELTNHLWQSTLVALAVGLLTALFRRDRAEVRYWLWFSASCKFFLPFSLLMDLGRHFAPIAVANTVAEPAVSFRMEQFAQPFPTSLTPAFHATEGIAVWIPLMIFAVWVCGAGLIALMRLQGWRSIRAAVDSSVAIDVSAVVEVRSSHGLLEPGVVGLFQPILLLPAGIVERLTPNQLKAVLAHESCHIRRRDNLTSSIHMIVEALFWFHPLVWWIGAHLMQERERACDEAVLRLGNEPHDYAEGILSVCKSYLESPLACVSGVTGSNLKQRIQAILAGRVAHDLTFAKKLTLAAVGMAMLALPMLIGSLSTPRLEAQSPASLNAPMFEEASIHSCPAFRRNTPDGWSPGKLRSQCTSVARLIQQAYGLFETGHTNPGSSVTVTGGPAWTASELYEIDARAPGSQSREVMNGPMMRALLESRFKLKAHHEIREVPVYELTVVPEGTRLEPFEGTCRLRDFDDPPSNADCGAARRYGNGFDLKAATMTDLCAGLLVLLDRPVIDKTGIAGKFNLRVDLSGEDPALLDRPRSLPALSDPFGTAPAPLNTDAAKNAMTSLGLKLESANGPGEFIVIDQIDRPSGN